MLSLVMPKPFDLGAEKKRISGEYEKLIKESRNSAHYILNHIKELDKIIDDRRKAKDQERTFPYNNIEIDSSKSAKQNSIECFKREKYFRESKDDELLHAEGLAILSDDERGIIDAVNKGDLRGYGSDHIPDPNDAEIYNSYFQIIEKLKPYTRLTRFNKPRKKKSKNLMILLDRYTDGVTGITWHIESRSSHTF